MQNTDEIWSLVDAKGRDFAALADRVFDMPELNFSEHRSAAEHTAMLRAQGFAVTEAVAGIPTAMLFVRNPTGVSHSPAEAAAEDDCLAGVAALADVLEGLACH